MGCYRYQKLMNLLRENDRCGRMLVKLYTDYKDQWVDAKDLREECNISLGEWTSFVNRAGGKFGAGVIETYRDFTKSTRQTTVRIPPESMDVVKRIIDKLYNWVD